MRTLFLTLTAAVMLLAPVSASAAVRGFVAVHPYARPYWYGGYWRPGYYWGPWGSWYGGCYPNSGEIKLDTRVKDAQVSVNGGYAGTTHEAKRMHLRPGNYNIEIREGGHSQFDEKIYVAAGKTVHLHPEL